MRRRWAEIAAGESRAQLAGAAARVHAGEQQLRLGAADSSDGGLAIGGAVRDGREQFADAMRAGLAGDVTQVSVARTADRF